MGKFFNNIILFLKSLFTNLDEWMHEHVQPSIEVVERLKAIVDSPVGNILVALIPGDADDKLKQFVSDYLQKAITTLHITSDIANEPDWTTKVAKTIDYLRTLSKPMQQAVYAKLAAEIAKVSGNATDVKGHSVDLLTQMQYSKLKEGEIVAALPELEPQA